MQSVASFGLHWFRRDLRLAGNRALAWSVREHQGRVLGVFCFDKRFLARNDFSIDRFQFFLESLRALRSDIESNGGSLIVLDVGPEEGFSKLFQHFKRVTLPKTVSFSRDYEPFAVARDARMVRWFTEKGVACHTDRDHLLLEPEEIRRDEPYKIFTPFSKNWLRLFQSKAIQVRVSEQAKAKAPVFTLKEQYGQDVLKKYALSNAKKVRVRIPPAGAQAALAQLKKFKAKIDAYADRRDAPGIPGTSGFSIYFKNGSLNISKVISELGLPGRKEGPGKFLKELIWREFYYYILAKFPDVEKEAFQPRFAKIPWENDEKWFDAWKEGRTGFPIVDAGMRQLNQTGWMHNRVRMIVASFLTKDLLISWQWGEQVFMERLLDGDLAPNNGGWQWAASTGCDPQPYFRIFNPELQSRKFDPQGMYIRKYVPELRGLNAQDIHCPKKEQRGSYPAPLVDHKVRREKALKVYASHSKK